MNAAGNDHKSVLVLESADYVLANISVIVHALRVAATDVPQLPEEVVLVETLGALSTATIIQENDTWWPRCHSQSPLDLS